jgi:hypothetical protein
MASGNGAPGAGSDSGRTRRLVSFLGLGNPTKPTAPDCYEEATFAWRDGRTCTTRLFPYAVDRLLGPFDELVFVGTKQVEHKWMASGALGRLFPGRRIEFVEVPLGGADEDPWRIFEGTLVALGLRAREDGRQLGRVDEVAVDVTHAFRPHPMIGIGAAMFAMSEWARTGQEATSLRVLYGAFDARRERQDGHAPIWDLTDILTAARWNAAIDALMRFGRADDLAALTRKLHGRIVRERPEGAPFPKLQAFGDAARDFADGLATARVPHLLTKLAPDLLRSLEAAGDDIRRHQPLLSRQIAALRKWAEAVKCDRPVSREGIEACVRLAGIYLRLERFSELSALLRETMVSEWALASSDHAAAVQPGAGDRAFDRARDAQEREFGEAVRRERHGALGWCGGLADLRNDVEHAGFRAEPRPSRSIRADLENKLEQAKGMLDELRALGPSPDHIAQAAAGSTCFVNCSNHPSAKWPGEQREAAARLGFGPVEDVPFPQVGPAEPLESVERTAAELAGRIVARGARGAHTAGEFTLTFALVARLQREGVRCFVATTERVSSEQAREDGGIKRESTFRFVGWREYPRLAERGCQKEEEEDVR